MMYQRVLEYISILVENIYTHEIDHSFITHIHILFSFLSSLIRVVRKGIYSYVGGGNCPHKVLRLFQY